MPCTVRINVAYNYPKGFRVKVNEFSVDVCLMIDSYVIFQSENTCTVPTTV